MRLDQLPKTMPVAQWDPNQSTVSFVRPTEHIVLEHDGPMVAVANRSLSAVMTPDHRVPARNTYGTVKELRAAELPALTTDIRVPVAGTMTGGDLLLGPWARLAAAVQADGYLQGGWARFHLVKPRKRARLRELATTLKLALSAVPGNDHEDCERLSCQWQHTPATVLLNADKTFNLPALLRLDLPSRQAFLDEVLHWDGHVPKTPTRHQRAYFSTVRANAEAVQAVAHVTGQQGVLRMVPQRDGRKPLWKVSFNQRTKARVHAIDAIVQPFVGKVYCLAVPSSWFLVRHNGAVSVTGNCNFGQGPKGAQEKILKETDTVHDIRKIARVMDIYKVDLFPGIPKWQREVQLQADRDGYLRNAFGYVHRFNRVFSWQQEFGKWVKVPGDDAEATLAMRPQSNAAAIIKEAILRLYFSRFEEAGQYLRLQIHDEVFAEVPEAEAGRIDAVMQEEMEKPIPQLVLPSEWGMGPMLTVLTEGKSGGRWGTMH